MSTGAKRPREEALSEAHEFRQLFIGCYANWQIAGSIRREKPEVGDVEHVVIPAMAGGPSGVDLFGDPVKADAINMVLAEIDRLEHDGTFARAVYSDGKNRWGEKLRGVMYKGFRHEVFLCTRENWGNILAIRTGPAEFSQRLLTNLQHRGYRQHLGYVLAVGGPTDGQVVPCPQEIDFLKLCGVPWIEPKDRI